MMEPSDVIAQVHDMSIWHDRVWINQEQELFFVPIWRNGNTEFMYLAEQFGYKLGELEADYTGYAFVRDPHKRIAGQIWRAMENQGFDFHYCIEHLGSDIDPHFRTQHSFVSGYNVKYYIDLDNMRPTDNAHINSVIEHMQKIEHRRSFNTERQTISKMLDEHHDRIAEIYYADFLVWQETFK